jgi:hypothetical protein
MTVLEIYQQTIKPLPAADRLQLATLILNDISPGAVVDVRETWSEEDMQDLNRASWGHINATLENEDNAQPR